MGRCCRTDATPTAWTETPGAAQLVDESIRRPGPPRPAPWTGVCIRPEIGRHRHPYSSLPVRKIPPVSSAPSVAILSQCISPRPRGRGAPLTVSPWIRSGRPPWLVHLRLPTTGTPRPRGEVVPASAGFSATHGDPARRERVRRPRPAAVAGSVPRSLPATWEPASSAGVSPLRPSDPRARRGAGAPPGRCRFTGVPEEATPKARRRPQGERRRAPTPFGLAGSDAVDCQRHHVVDPHRLARPERLPVRPSDQ